MIWSDLTGNCESCIKSGYSVTQMEFEKQFAGAASTGETDSGTARRMTGRWLQFMSEKPDGVYMMGTCNSFKGIPDEYLRVGRWDSSPFYIGLPNAEEQLDILSFYGKKLDVEIPKNVKGLPKMENWTGAEIEACCEMGVKLEVPLTDAARFIIPQNLRGFDEADELKEFAISATSEVVVEAKGKRVERMIDK